MNQAAGNNRVPSFFSDQAPGMQDKFTFDERVVEGQQTGYQSNQEQGAGNRRL